MRSVLPWCSAPITATFRISSGASISVVRNSVVYLVLGTSVVRHPGRDGECQLHSSQLCVY